MTTLAQIRIKIKSAEKKALENGEEIKVIKKEFKEVVKTILPLNNKKGD